MIRINKLGITYISGLAQNIIYLLTELYVETIVLHSSPPKSHLQLY